MSISVPQSVQEALTFETYPPPPAIAGVWVKPLRKIRSSNGAFMEYLRLDEAGTEDLPDRLTPRQISVAWAAPQRVNAFHIHVKAEQNELWCVLSGQLLVWLIDLRAHSATLGIRRKLILSGEEPALVSIPSGVAHGYQAGGTGATLLYAADAQFDLHNPNEGRISWDHFGPELWAEDRG